tara:strand:- start:488 stop:964 length:477 start_codon:yes stop_codon:yes gene_type:complete
MTTHSNCSDKEVGFLVDDAMAYGVEEATVLFYFQSQSKDWASYTVEWLAEEAFPFWKEDHIRRILQSCVAKGALDLDYGAVKDAWLNAIDRIKEQRPAMGNILTVAEIVGLRGNVLELGFAPQHEFQKQQTEKRQRWIEAVVEEVLGVPLTLDIWQSW